MRAGTARRRALPAQTRALSLLLLCCVASTGAAQTAPNTGPTSHPATSFTGLLQTPEAHLFTGASATSIPIDVPPGRKPLTLQLALHYMSGAGPSLYGYGWDLPLGRIERSTRFGVIGCGNQNHVDDFVLTLPSATVEFHRSAGVGKARVEESFLKILHNSGSNSWTVWDKSGIKYTFGGAVDARAGTDVSVGDPNFAPCSGSGQATVLAYTFSWALTRIEDPNGNGVDFTYLKSTSGMVRPQFIRYGGTTANHPFEVELVWSDAVRPAVDAILNGLAGFGATLDVVLKDIVVRFNGQDIRTYHFDYDVTRAGRVTFLDAVTLLDGAGNALQRYNGSPATTEFQYHDNVTSNRFGFQSGPTEAYELSGQGGRHSEHDGDSHTDIFDITGDGIVDWVSSVGCATSHKWIVRRGSKAGFTSAAENWPMAGAPSNDACHIRNGVRSGHDSWTKQDTIDLNGDGIPDHIDANGGPGSWNVFFGYFNAMGGGGFHSPVLWSAPGDLIRHSDGTGTSSHDDLDLIDINGDGRPDYVAEGDSDPLTAGGYWLVHYNLGNGFAPTAYQFATRFSTLRQSEEGNEVFGVYDMNGDGLVDQVGRNATEDGFDVYYNTGQRIGVLVPNGQYHLTAGTPWPVPAGVRPDDLDLRHSWVDEGDNSYVSRQLLDLNGDGLPDLVYAPGGTDDWVVALNQGNGFSPTVRTWDLGSSAGALIRQVSAMWTRVDVFDYDGDGMLDLVRFTGGPTVLVQALRNQGGAWCETSAGSQVCHQGPVLTNVIPNADAGSRGQRPDLLVSTQNSLGAATFLEYRPSTQWTNGLMPFTNWTVSRIAHDDGMCSSSGCATQSAHSTATHFIYYNGKFDPLNRQFLGFGQVQTEQAGAASASRLGRLTYFYQDAARAGKLLATLDYDAKNGGTFSTQLLRSATHYWDCVSPTTGSPITCPVMPTGNVWVRLVQSEQRTISNFNHAAYRTVRTINHAWDACATTYYGNVTHSSIGDVNNLLRAHTYTTFACKNDSAGYIVDKPTHVKVRDTYDAVTLEEKWFAYDGGTLTKGNVTRVDTWLDQWQVAPGAIADCPGGGKSCVHQTMGYDPYGNVTSVADHHHRTTETEYDLATHLYPELVIRHDSYRTRSTYDPACGTRLSESMLYAGTSVPAERRRWKYDSFCRLIRTAMPGEDIETLTPPPHAQYFYSLGAVGVPTKIQVKTREPAAGGTRDAYTLSDGLGRVIQQQRTAVVNGQAAFLSETTEYDAQGNAVKRYAPDGVEDFGIFDQPAPSVGVTVLAYDALQRPTRVTNPDGTSRETDHTVAWQTTATDECYVSGSCAGGGKTIEIRDALGRVTERQIFDQNTWEARTLLTYDELGRLTRSIQGATVNTVNPATEIRHTYDSLGRKLQTEDPDSGVWKYRYDAVGNLTVADDPEPGHHVQHCYGVLYRETKSCAFSGNYSVPWNCTSACPGEQISYTYDQTSYPYGWGRLSQVADSSGISVINAYDARGRVLRETKTIDPPGAPGATSAQMSYAYDAADHLTHLTYPDGEVVAYGYNAAGQVQSLKSLTHQVDYLTSLTYDVFGRPRRIQHGNTAVDERTYYGTDENFRLARLQTTKTNTTHLDYHYVTYTDTGRLTQLIDEGFKGPAPGYDMNNSVLYGYDGLGRLTVGYGDKVGAHFFAYEDHLGNLTQRDNQPITYEGTRPHTPATFGSTTLDHNSNGNRTDKGSTSYAYDYRDRLTDINGQVQFVYDYTNRRVAKISGGTVTAYYSRFLDASNGHIAKYYYAGDLMIAMHRRAVSGFALLTPPRAIELARVDPTHPAVVLHLRRDLHLPAGIGLTLLTAGLVLAPWQRRRVVGIAIRHGDVIAILIAFTLTTLPIPLIVQPAHAQDQGCDPPPTETPTRTPTRTGTPTRTPTPVPIGELYHFHVDHIGSTQLITDLSGNPHEYIRYTPFGTIRQRYLGNGNPAGFDQTLRYEFTGYETESVSGLQYAGARFYDPALGMFLTHDPARQFANPFAYGPWDPVNGNDPSGALWGFVLLGSIVGASFTASAIQAAANGASLGQALRAGAKAAVITGLTGVGLGIVGIVANAAHPVVSLAYNAALTGSGAYSTVQGFNSGQGVLGVVGAVGLAFGLYGLAKAGSGVASWAGGVAQDANLTSPGASADDPQFANRFASNATPTDADVAAGTAVMTDAGPMWTGAVDYNTQVDPGDLNPRGILRAGAKLGIKGAAKDVWPKTAKEMDDLLGSIGKRVPDTPSTVGRGKVLWRPNSETKIIFEQHPYHSTAPNWHKGPHWHLDTPGGQHQRYVPGDKIPGY